MEFVVIIESDSDNPDNSGVVVWGPCSEKEATAYVMGVEYTNDSALAVRAVPLKEV